MPRWLKVVVWIAVFSACAGVGAYVAAHTDPFPPGVEDPGARDGTPSPNASLIGPPEEVPSSQRWTLVLQSDSMHTFRVGGSCRTSWRSDIALSVDEAGTVDGSGRATLEAPRACDFPVAQVQTQRVELDVTGRRKGGHLALEFRVIGLDPPRSDDAGGFVASIETGTFSVGDGDRLRATVQSSDGKEGTIRSALTIQARCVRGCEG